MKIEEVEQVLKEVLESELDFDVTKLDFDKSIQENGIDSIEFMSLVVYMEERLDINILFDEEWGADVTKIKLKNFAQKVCDTIQV